jgi:phenylalanyl-tRNA synthetase alpha chain
MKKFFKKLFHKEVPISLRPSYFPFVEPGLELFIKLGDRWLEVMGAGMVHPEVFEAVGYAPGEWQGFAFGMSLERIAMIKWKIPDIRMFYDGDLRFIRQF